MEHFSEADLRKENGPLYLLLLVFGLAAHVHPRPGPLLCRPHVAATLLTSELWFAPTTLDLIYNLFA